MLAFSPPFFPTFGWPLEDQTIYNLTYNVNDNNNLNRGIDTSDGSPISMGQIGQLDSAIFGSTGGDAVVVKKLNHNASERDRRKRINSLYSSLFSLLPATDESKKLSIPTTVLRVVKYIPELQKEVKDLIQKKEELTSRFSSEHENSFLPQKKKRKYCNIANNDTSDKISSSLMSITQISDNEFMIQISTIKLNKCLFEALQALEENGLILLNASSFQSHEQRIFHNLHLQVQGKHKLDPELLRMKILSIFEKREEHFL